MAMDSAVTSESYVSAALAAIKLKSPSQPITVNFLFGRSICDTYTIEPTEGRVAGSSDVVEFRRFPNLSTHCWLRVDLGYEVCIKFY
jgi:hypothetical protein